MRNSILFWFVSRIKRPVHEVGHSPAPGAYVRISGAIHLLLPVSLHGVDRHNFAFTFYLCSFHSSMWEDGTALCVYSYQLNPLKPNDAYIGRTAPLTSRRCILYIYSTNIRTKYFKHAVHSPFFPLQNAVYFIMLSCLVPV